LLSPVLSRGYIKAYQGWTQRLLDEIWSQQAYYNRAFHCFKSRFRVLAIRISQLTAEHS
jgi:hypothetical protein